MKARITVSKCNKTHRLASDNGWHHHISLLKIKKFEKTLEFAPFDFEITFWNADFTVDYYFFFLVDWVGRGAAVFFPLSCLHFQWIVHMFPRHMTIYSIWPPTLNSIHFTFQVTTTKTPKVIHEAGEWIFEILNSDFLAVLISNEKENKNKTNLIKNVSFSQHFLK